MPKTPRVRLTEDDIRVSPVSKPFVIAAVILVFAGSIIGSVWMMYLLGADIAFARAAFPLHKAFQVDGFLTLLVMGVGYMIVPRFRNVQLPSTRLAYFSFLLVSFSIAASVISTAGSDVATIGIYSRTLGISVFAVLTLWTLRIPPKLLRTADYFIALSVLMLLATNIMHIFGYAKSGGSLSEVQVLLLFAVFMIFAIQFKTMPSFLGFIRPRRRLSLISFGLATASAVLSLSSALYGIPLLAIVFNATLLSCVIVFAGSLNIYGGFDNNEILRLIQGEKQARYLYTIRHQRLAFLFLLAGIGSALAFNASSRYILYDLAIHYTTIGFIGTTIALYLPLMLPPITGKMVHFTRFSTLPILLVIAALAVRTIGDLAITLQATLAVSYALMSTGWLVVAALSSFVVMIHRSMRKENTIDENF